MSAKQQRPDAENRRAPEAGFRNVAPEAGILPAPGRYTEEQLAELIGVLPPAPAAWVQSAQELPAARKALDGLVERAREASEQRSAILADLEASLREAGVEPRRALVDELRARLRESS